MTLEQFQAAFSIAKDLDRDLTGVDDSTLYGYGLPGFKPVYTTLEAVAKIMRWQALQFNGQWNALELNDVGNIGREKFLILG
jgi:hypothetical protein